MTLRSTLPLLLCTALTAQQTAAVPAVAANRFVPADSCFVARIAAPAKWQQRFARTQVAKLLQAPTLAPLVAQATAAVDAGLDQLRQSGEFDADLIDGLLRDYAGDIVCSVQIDWDDLAAAIADDRPPAMSAVFALTPADGFDLGALAAAIDHLIEREAQDRRALRDLTVGDVRLRVTADDDELQACVPTLIDGHLVMALTVGRSFDQSIERLLGTADRFAGDLDTRPMQVHANLGQLIGAMIPAVAERADLEGAPIDVAAVLRALGLATLQQFSLSLDADEKHLAAEFDLALGDGETGMLGIALAEQTPQLLRLVPPSAEWFSVGAFDVGALYRTIRNVWTEAGDLAPMSFEDAMAAFAEQMKVRLEEDLIAHLGTELLMVEDIDPDADAADVDELVPAALVGSCVGLSLRDGKAFGAAIEQLLRARGLHASRKSEDYAGTKIHRLRLAGVVQLEYAITDDLLLLVLGEREGARRNLRAVLDAHAAGERSVELPAAVQALVQALPAGWSGLSVTPIGQVLQGLGDMADTIGAMQGLPAGSLELATALQGIAGDIQRLGIDHMVTTTYTTRRSMRYRMRW